MAYGDCLPNGNQVTRGCSGGYDSGEVTASAFAMRKPERSLLRISVDWVECSYADSSEQDWEGSAKRLRVSRVRPPYAIVGVADVRLVSRGEWALDAKEFGNSSNPCHCGITGFSGSPIDLELQSELAVIANRLPVLEAPK